MRFTNLGARVVVGQASLWATNATVVGGTDCAVVCDPAFTTAEIEAVRAVALEAAHDDERISLFLTHADFDHICGVGLFPGATVLGARDTEVRLEDGSARAELVLSRAEWSEQWPLDIHLDRVVAPGELIRAGTIAVLPVSAHHNGRDGLAYVFPEERVLVAGDYFSPESYPIVLGRIEPMIEAVHSLLRAAAEYDVEHVVPAHGWVLGRAEAEAIGRDDVDYLERLRDAASQAVAEGVPHGAALLAVFEVEPPRAARLDFDVYDVRAGNARLALADARAAP